MTKEILKSTAWEQPSHYMGHSPVGHYVICTRTRDSSIMENTNFTEILKELEPDPDNEGDEPSVYDFRVSHFLCGWAEYLIVRNDAPQATLDLAAEILEQLEAYPVYSDDAYAVAQYEAADEYWGALSLENKVQECSDNNVSILAARRECPPIELIDSWDFH